VSGGASGFSDRSVVFSVSRVFFAPKRAQGTNFSSRHPLGVNFSFADGSVRQIRFGATTQRNPNCSSDWYLSRALAGFRDGSPASPQISYEIMVAQESPVVARVAL
jgi:prepilin-type processing-associated H-X9-DG protein